LPIQLLKLVPHVRMPKSNSVGNRVGTPQGVTAGSQRLVKGVLEGQEATVVHEHVVGDAVKNHVLPPAQGLLEFLHP